MSSVTRVAILTSVFLISCNPKTNTNSQNENLMSTKTTNQVESESFTATILVDQSPAVAFKAIKNFRAWWSEDIEGNTDKLTKHFSITIKIFTYVKSN
jgi:hypothetical protein